MTERRDKLRAVFLAAIMVLSVVAMTATFAGAAAAQDDTELVSAAINAEDRTIIDDDPMWSEEWPADVEANYDIQYADGATQDAELGVDIEEDFEGTLEIDISDSNDVGIEVTDIDVSEPGDVTVESTDIDNDLSRIDVDLESAAGYSGTIDIEFTLDAPDGITGSGVANYRFSLDGSNDQANYRYMGVDATGIVSDDSKVETGADLVENLNFEATEEAGDDGSFFVWEEQAVTLLTDEVGDTVDVYQLNEGDDGEVRRGSFVAEIGTAPGSGNNMIPAEDLDGPGQYLLDFDEGDYVAIETAPLDLEADWTDDEVPADETIEIEATGNDRTGADAMIMIFEGDDLVDDRMTEMDGDGFDSQTFVPEDDFDGEGDYVAMYMHLDSGIIAATGLLEVGPPLDEEVNIVSPTTDDQFARGDIVPIELEFENTDTGVLTFGDRDEGQAVEVNVSVRDVDESGTGTVLVNTFQFGDGERNHGFFAGDDGTEVSVNSTEAIDHLGGGGSAGGAVLAGASYDLVSTSGDEPWKEEGAGLDDRGLVRLNERGTDALEVWTAPGTGENELDVDTVDEIEEALEDELITPSDGEIADNDFLVVQLQSTGLEGVLHEGAMLAEERDIAVDETGDPANWVDYLGEADARDAASFILDREDDHDIEDEFFATDYVTNRTLGTVGQDLLDLATAETDPGPNLQPYLVDFEQEGEGVFAGTDDDGNLDEYFIPIKLDSEDEDIIFDPNDADRGLTPGDGLVSEFTLQSPASEAAMANFPDNLMFVEFDPVTGESLESETFEWTFVDDSASVDMDGDVLSVPQEDNVEITGTTNVAAGTNLSVQFTTVSGEDDPFYKPTSDRVAYEEDAPNSWSVTADFGNETVGTEFEVRIERAGQPGILTDDLVPGVVSDEPVVNEFTFDDQRSGGNSVVVQTFDTTQGGFIGIYNDDGDRIGWSSPQDIGEQTNVPIALDEPIEENQELTAVAYRTADRVYEDEDGEPVSVSAQITVEDLDPAEFSVSNLEPDSVDLDEPGETVDVTATITNDGDEADVQSVELDVDGTVVDEQELALDGGDEGDVVFQIDTSDLDYGAAAQFTVSTDDDSASGVINIGPEPTPEPTPTPTPEPTPTPTPEPADDTDDADDDGAGFGVVVALLAFLGAALLAVRRQTQFE